MSDPGKEVLAAVVSSVPCVIWLSCLALLGIFMSGKSCEQLAKPNITMSISTMSSELESLKSDRNSHFQSL